MGPSSTAANRRLCRVAAVSVTDATSTPLGVERVVGGSLKKSKA